MNCVDKKCGKCLQVKPASEFSVKDKSTGRLASRCKECVRAYGKQHYAANTQAYVAKAARHNEVARERNAELVRLSLAGQSCAQCGNPDEAQLCHYNGSVENGQAVHQAVHAALSEAAVLDAIGRSVIICIACRTEHFTSLIKPWAMMSHEQRKKLQAERAAAGIAPAPSSTYKNYRPVAAPGA